MSLDKAVSPHERSNCHPMATAELANMGGLPTWIYPYADCRSEGTPKDALVPLRRGVCASCVALGDATDDTCPLPQSTERHVRADQCQRRRVNALALIAEDSVRS